MAKFCKYCGSPLEEGQVCNCEGAQAAARQAAAQQQAPTQTVPDAQAPVQTAAPAQSAAVNNAKSLLIELKDVFLTYLKAPRKGITAALESNNSLALGGLIAVVNALVAFLYIWSLMSKVLGLVSTLAGAVGVKIGYPIFAMLVAGIVSAIVFIGLSALALFVCAKLMKREMDIKKALVNAAVSSIYPSVLLLAGIILGFLAWQLQLLVLVIATIIWAINACEEIREYSGLSGSASIKNMAILTGIILVVVLVAFFITFKILGWCIGEISIAGVKLSDAGDLIDLLGDLF